METEAGEAGKHQALGARYDYQHGHSPKEEPFEGPRIRKDSRRVPVGLSETHRSVQTIVAFHVALLTHAVVCLSEGDAWHTTGDQASVG
jgi:hypothetical protein